MILLVAGLNGNITNSAPNWVGLELGWSFAKRKQSKNFGLIDIWQYVDYDNVRITNFKIWSIAHLVLEFQ